MIERTVKHHLALRWPFRQMQEIRHSNTICAPGMGGVLRVLTGVGTLLLGIALCATPAMAGTHHELPAAIGPGLTHPLSPAQAATGAQLCAQVADNAGFNGGNLITAVAVGLAESGCNPSAQNHNGPTRGCPNGSTDRGLWQINDCYHPNVTNACAYNAQ